MQNVNKKEFRKFKKVGYNKKELISFYRACYKSYLKIIANPPTAIVAPLRGSEPIVKAILLFASLERKSHLIPRIFYPRIGQINYDRENKKLVTKIDQNLAPSLSNREQKQELERTIDKIINLSKGKKRATITIIDEVRWGGSVSQAIDLIEDIIARKRKKIKLGINAITVAEKGFVRGREYQHLKQRIPVKEFIVPRVFTMDSNKFLYPLIESNQLNLKWPVGVRKPKLGITRRAITSRGELFANLEAIWLNGGKKQGVFGQAKKKQRLHKVPK